MRDYDDDNIRLYTPVLQRVIILLAVIIAVPVVMWTITTVVRTYVAPPKAPTFQRMTETQPADTTSDAAPAAAARSPAAEQPQSAALSANIADARTAASDARTALIDIKKPASAPPQPPAPQIATAVQSAVSQPPSAQPPSAQTPAVQPVTVASVQPTPPPASAVAAAPAPSMAAMPVVSPAGPGSTAAPADKLAWPNPNTKSPPDVGASAGGTDTATASGQTLASAQPPAASDSATEELPAAEPIAGRVPLPPRRPVLFAMVQSTAIPLPRPRPPDAPAATPSTPADAPSSIYDPGLESGHY
jgi:hypothetical protein